MLTGLKIRTEDHWRSRHRPLSLRLLGIEMLSGLRHGRLQRAVSCRLLRPTLPACWRDVWLLVLFGREEEVELELEVKI